MMTRLYNAIARRFSWLKNGRQQVLVYTMGKVGSSTVYDVFRLQFPWLPVYHVHFLSDRWLREKLPSLHEFYHANIKAGERIKEQLKSHPDHRLKIITIVREPMSREISNIFQNWKAMFNGKHINDLTYSQVSDYLDNVDFDYSLTWFDTEFKEWTGIDLYQFEFDKNRGYSIYRTKNSDVLCLRLDKMNDCLKMAIKDLTGLEIELDTRSNVTENKEGKELYQQLMSSYKCPKDKISQIYDSVYMRHFYTDEEINSFKTRWTE